MSINVCTFIGNAGKDCEVRFTAGGQAVANVSIACSDKYKNKAGEMVETTEWVNLVFWGKLAEIAGEYITRGKMIYVSGKFSTRKWQNKEGADQYSVEIVCDKLQLLGGKSDPDRSAKPQGGGSGGANNAYQEPVFDPSDEIPFLRGPSFYNDTER